jgi:hypothetical protein
MNTATRLFAFTTVLAAAAAMAPAAWADTETAPRSRAEVKQETIAAMKAGQIVSGEFMPTETPASTRTREERKAETMVARGKGELVHSGISTYRASLSQQGATAKSAKTRVERKSETMDAIKNRQVMQPGEAA